MTEPEPLRRPEAAPRPQAQASPGAGGAPPDLPDPTADPYTRLPSRPAPRGWLARLLALLRGER